MHITKLILVCCSLLLLASCTNNSIQGSSAAAKPSAQKPAQSASTGLADIMAAHWQDTLAANPVFATSVGERRYDDRLSDPSLQAYEAYIERMQAHHDALVALDSASLNAEEKLNYDLLLLSIATELEASKFGGKYMLFTNRGGPHLSITRMPSQLPFFKAADYESYLSRLDAIPDYLSRATARLQAGLDAGWVQPCAPMQGFERSIEQHIVSNAEDSVFMQALTKSSGNISAAQLASYTQQASDSISNKIIPALKNFLGFYQQSYAPACRDEIGTDKMPDGAAYYQHRISRFTTTAMTADEIHALGLSEVKRIRAEMDEVIKEAGFKGSFQEWLDHLANDSSLYPKTPEERLVEVARISKKIDGQLPALFGRLPRMPYGIKEIPADIAEKSTTAYYNPPAGDGTRAGFHFVNTSLLHTRPQYQLEALSLHEAVPGHHLQIALAQELDLPNFRRYSRVTAFIEGWGLYAERLGLETGFYETPYTNFGRLSYEMWRACRLVVDTGMHAKNWTRQQAIDFMAENSGLSMNNITTEVDRYITWPGQALAYKIGELKIRELRTRAEQALGNSFDIRAFHDKVLENGAIPLNVLEEVVIAWIAEQKQ